MYLVYYNSVGILSNLMYSLKCLILLNIALFHSLKCFTSFNVYGSKVNIGFSTVIFNIMIFMIVNGIPICCT